MIQFHNQLPAEIDITIELYIDRVQRLHIRTDLFDAIDFLSQWCKNHQEEITEAKENNHFELNIKI